MADRFSVAILAGGESRRMGSNKALLMLGDRPVIEHVIGALAPLSDDVFIVGGSAADYERFGLPHVADQYDFRASIVGVYTALAAAREDHCLVVSCDMPFASRALARRLAELAGGSDVVAPAGEGGFEPLFAVYARSCMGTLRERIEHKELALRGALARLNVREAGPEEIGRFCDPATAFLNVNTAEQLEEAGRLAAARQAIKPEPGDGSQVVQDTDFARRPPLVCLVGKKNSGKTTFLEKLVRLLGSRGIAVAYVKHDVHGFDMDREGTDTWRLTRAGARDVTISSPAAIARLRQVENEMSLDEITTGIGRAVDIIIVEGYKTAAADKIEISRSARSDSLACPEEELLAVISDRPGAASSVPVFGLEDVEAVAGLLLERYSLDQTPKTGRGSPK